MIMRLSKRLPRFDSAKHVLAGKPLRTFPRHALARFPLERNRSSDKESRPIKLLKHVLIGKPLRTFPGHALAAGSLTAAVAASALFMASVPAQAAGLAVSGPGLPASVTPTDGESLWNIVSSAAIPTPPGLDSKNSQLRGYVMAFGGGTESVFSLGELNPGFGGTNLAPYISVVGNNYTLVDPNAGASGRDVSNLTQLVIGWAPAAAGHGGQSAALTLSGMTNSPGSYNITTLSALPSVQIAASGATYTGVPLYDFVNTSDPGSVTRQVVELTATDGYVVTYSLAELDPAFGGSLNNILAYASTGNDFPASAVARTVFPGDNKHGRWVSNVDSVVVELATPGPVPGAGVLGLGVLLLAGFAARSRGCSPR